VCVVVLHGSETWPVKKENELTLQMRMVSWLCGVEVTDRFTCSEFRETPGIDDITRMWANAQRDGRPAEHRWRPLFNAAKFG